MDRNLKLFSYGIFALLVVVLSMWFIMATSAPTSLIFNNNVTAAFDEGNFSVNWTSGGGEVKNYSVYLFADNTLYKKNWNDSVTGYSFNNWTEANYTFIIGALNTTGGGNEANSTTNISIYVDRTAPVITLPVYTNATAKKNTDQLTLNISAIDASSGTTGSHCLIDVNGTNQTVTISNGWCNSTVINLTGASNGNQTLKVYVNDTVNIFGLNNSFVVQMDSTAPTISLSKSSSTRTTITVSFSCSATSGVSSCSLSSSLGTVSGSIISGLSCGNSYTITVTAEDNAGNTATSSESFSTSSCGGGLLIPQPPRKSHLWTLITPGVATIMKDFDSEFGIRQIQIDVNNPAQNVKITVTKHDGKPAEVSVEKSGKVYQYLQIGAENLENTLDRATVEFRVEKSWAVGVELGKNDIAVSRYNEAASRWNELITTLTEEDATYYYYEVELDRFSYFAISEKAVTEEPVPGLKSSKAWLWIFVAIVIIAIIVWQMKTKKK